MSTMEDWLCVDCKTQVGAVGSKVVGYVFVFGEIEDVHQIVGKRCEPCHVVERRSCEGWNSTLANLLYEPPKPVYMGGPVTPDMEYEEGEWSWVIQAVHQPDGTVINKRVKFVVAL